MPERSPSFDSEECMAVLRWRLLGLTLAKRRALKEDGLAESLIESDSSDLNPTGRFLLPVLSIGIDLLNFMLQFANYKTGISAQVLASLIKGLSIVSNSLLFYFWPWF